MKTSSLLAVPSAHHRDSGAAQHLTSSPLLVNVVPFEAALQRLLHDKVGCDEQLSSYSLQQAYRGLVYGVRANRLALRNFHQSTSSQVLSVLPSASSSYPSLPTAHQVMWENGENVVVSKANGACVVRGWQAVLYRMALAATRSAADLECVVFLSTRILCDAASAYGEGNERPCCTREWTQALTKGLPTGKDFTESRDGSDDLDFTFARLVHANRRYELGFLSLLSHTLRMVATGRVKGHRLCSDFSELFAGVVAIVVPQVARLVEESERDEALLTATNLSSQHVRTAAPSRLTVDLNHLLLHAGYWLSMDIFAAHVDSEVDAGGEKNSVLSPDHRKRPAILDHDQLASLWSVATVLRNALRRGVAWVEQEVLAASSEESSGASTALLRKISQQVEDVFVDLIKRQETLAHALWSATREFEGAISHDVRRLTEAKWAHTLQMVFLLRNVTGAWVRVHGGLGVSTLCPDVLLSSYKDLLMLMANTLLRVPTLESQKETEQNTFVAIEATLSACIALVVAAPTSAMQAEFWAADTDITQQIHGLLVQRALRYRDGRVLKLASLLSRAILDSVVRGGELAGFAANSSDQLIELLANEDDAAARCVGELLSVSILAHPYRLIPALFRLLQHGSAVTRRHVLEILCSLPDLVSAQEEVDELPQPSSSEEVAFPPRSDRSDQNARSFSQRRRGVLRLLAENLLLQLQDEELCVRMLSSTLFAKVHPEDVMLPLLNLCVQRDTTGRKQSAAIAALTAVLEAHTESAETYIDMILTGFEVFVMIIGGGPSGPRSIRTAEVAGNDSAVAGVPIHDWIEAVHRPSVPQTPGDILPHAFLYATDTADEEDNEHDSAAALYPHANTRGTVANDTNAAQLQANGRHKRKEGQLRTVLFTLTDRWIRAAASVWSYARHSLPIIQLLARQGNPVGVDVNTTASASECSDANDARVQWVMKYTLRLTSALTSLPSEDVSDGHIVQLRTVHLCALWDVFFAPPASSSSCDDASSFPITLWGSCIAEGASVKHRGSTSSKEAVQASLRTVLLPLLCLRSCALGTFFTEGALEVAVERVLTACKERRLVMRSTREDLLLKGEEAVDKWREQLAEELARLWCVLWGTTVEQHSETSVTAFFSIYPDVQRVVLEVLCCFPAGIFFRTLSKWTELDAGGSGAAGPDISVSRLFSYRIYLFAVSFYVASSLQALEPQLSSSDDVARTRREREEEGRDTSLRLALQHRSTLGLLLNCVLPEWLMREPEKLKGPSRSLTPPAPPTPQVEQAEDTSREEPMESLMQRLCVAAVDAAGLIGVLALLPREKVCRTSSMPSASEVLLEELGGFTMEVLEAPLITLTTAYRKAVPQRSGIAASSECRPSSNDLWVRQLTQLQLCLRIHESLIRASAVHPRVGADLLLGWFRRFLRLFVDLCNSACRSGVGKDEHGCRAAVDSCDVVFRAVLFVGKLADGIASSTDMPERTSLLMKLPLDDKLALLSFSVGCVRFRASDEMQSAGVRLLSALLVAAPELFMEKGMWVAPSASAPIANRMPAHSFSIVADAQQSPLAAATSSLQSVALLHADRPTRSLAEEVLRMLEKAISASTP